MCKSVTVFAPASVSNLGCGFDVFGFAMQEPGDRVKVCLSAEEPDVHIAAIHGDEGRLPLDPAQNTASIAARKVLQKAGSRQKISLEIYKGMPFASGIGSSAASAAAAAMGVNVILGEPLDEKSLLECVIAAEAFISGSAHADNAAPALWGGVILSRCAGCNPPDVLKLPRPESLRYVLLYTPVPITTRQARAALPLSIPLKTAAGQWANTAALAHAFHQKDWALLSRCMVDAVAEPVRQGLIPHYAACRKAAMNAGALTFNISGSGPSLFSFTTDAQCAEDISAAWRAVCQSRNMEHKIWSGPIRPKGAEIVEKSD